jgi:hypothetical protein
MIARGKAEKRFQTDLPSCGAQIVVNSKGSHVVSLYYISGRQAWARSGFGVARYHIGKNALRPGVYLITMRAGLHSDTRQVIFR